MKELEDYNNALKALYDHVGFVEDWVLCPIDDCTDKYWNVYETKIEYADSLDEFKGEYGNFYIDEIYTQRFYDKWVYEGKDLTMVMCDPHTDEVKWFRFFDNKKRTRKRTVSIF